MFSPAHQTCVKDRQPLVTLLRTVMRRRVISWGFGCVLVPARALGAQGTRDTTARLLYDALPYGSQGYFSPLTCC